MGSNAEQARSVSHSAQPRAYPRYAGGDLRAFVGALFEHHGVGREDAAMGAEALVRADEMGIDSHGVAHLVGHGHYLPGLRDGTVDPHARPVIVRETASTALLDGRHGLGPVAATRAMRLAMAKARATGAGFVAVTNGRHYGAAAHYALLAADAGMIGLSMTIGGLGVVPTHGRGRRLGINPLSVAAPAGRDHPFLLDIASSVVAAGKLELARLRGESVPLGWIVDRDGRPSTDPEEFYRGGALLPLGGAAETGGYKGYGLSVMIDILCGVLSGLGFAAMLGAEPARPHLLGAFDVTAFRPLADFQAMMDDLLGTLRATEPAAGAERVLVHGDREFEASRERRARGIPLHPRVVSALEAAGREAGVAFPSPV